MTVKINQSQMEDVVEHLREMILWWDTWNASEEPHDVYNPPIASSRKLLNSLNIEIGSEEPFDE